MSAIDPVRRVGVEPAAPAARLTRRRGDEERPRDQHPPPQREDEPEHEPSEDDGLPHVDVLA